MRAHTEKLFSLRPKPGRDAHPERKGVGLPSVRSMVKRWLNNSCRTVLPGLYLPMDNFLVSFSTPDLPEDPSGYTCAKFSKMDSSPEADGVALASQTMGWCPLLLTPKEPFCTCAMSPFPKDRKYMTS